MSCFVFTAFGKVYNPISSIVIRGFTVNERLGHFLGIPCISDFKKPISMREPGNRPGDSGYCDFAPSLMFSMWWDNLTGVSKFSDYPNDE